jgi:porphobilinogen synthase
MFIISRPRRNRKSASIRNLVRETILNVNDLVWPLFVQEGKNKKTPILSLPGCNRLSIDLLIQEAKEARDLGINAIAVFPLIAENKKDSKAKESKNAKGLYPETIRALKAEVPEMVIMTDVAMDPYSSDGHDGFVANGEIVNDITLEILGEMALVQAEAGADYIAPSDMMDGRVGYLRETLDENGFTDVGIMAYSAKYCSALYGPFRDALDSAPKSGDKKTYQMDPANSEEALREVMLDLEEGADIVMVKPAHAYLDILYRVKEISSVPVAAYHVSGEYAMIKAAAEKGWLDEKKAMMEITTGIKRAGADIIFTYYAKEIAQLLKGKHE